MGEEGSGGRAEGAAAEFERHRGLLFGIAYRMLGSAADAEDAVQEAWLRWHPASARAGAPRSFLAATVTRLCIDHLRSARVRREEYVGPWLPEPLVGALDPAWEAGAAWEESLSTAFLVLLQSLSPVERAAFLLRDVFGFGYAEVAAMVGKGETACRQVLHRARERVAEGRARFPAEPVRAEALTRTFVDACRTGDLDALMGVLSADVVAWSDGGGLARAALNPVYGADRVARLMAGLSAKYFNLMDVRLTPVNGAPGFVAYLDGAPLVVASFAVDGGAIRGVYVVVNPRKLRRVPAAGAPGEEAPPPA